MSVTTTYRTCPRSGLQFENQAEWLIKANAFVGVVWLLIGGLLAIGVVLTRWPAVHWLPADTFYMVLTAHGLDMLIFWIIFFEVAVLYFASSTLLRCRIATPKIAWLAFLLMVVGSVLNNVAVFQGGSSVMMTSYVPMLAAPNFYLGIILFAVGALVACFEDEISNELVRALARREPLRAVFRDSGFSSDAARINAEQIFRELSPATDVKVI